MINPKREVRELSLTFRGKPLDAPLKSLFQIVENYSGNEKIIMYLSSKGSIEMDYLD